MCSRSIVGQLLKSDMHEVLLNNDQLQANMRNGLVLQKFTEPPLNFRPTYKFDIGSQEYDSGPKNRIPSWTDRILYVPSDKVKCIAYNSDTTITTSDHRPVYASFIAEYNSFVQLDANQNAIISNPAAVQFTSESQVCNIM